MRRNFILTTRHFFLMTRIFVTPPLVVLIISFLASGALLSGCSESTKPKPPSGECQNCLVTRTSPANVLQNLRVIYSVRDNELSTPADAHSLAANYRTLFHPDFRFYFLSGDQPFEFADQNWWGRDSSGVGLSGEVPAFDSLMTFRASGFLTEISLSWAPLPAVPDNRTGGGGGLLHPDWMYVHVTQINLAVRHADGLTRMVPQGQAEFYFGPDPVDTTLWVVTEWRETPLNPGIPVESSASTSWRPKGDSSVLTAAGTASTQSLSMSRQNSSWGQIKGLYR